MYIQHADRKQLIEVLAGNDITYNIGAITVNDFPSSPPLLDEMYLLWEENPRNRKELPAIIVVHDDMVRDFFAWASTFISTLRPFSAYIRVLPFKLLSSFKDIPPKPSLMGMEELSAAVIISESITISPERTSGHLLTPLICSSTFSHCMTRALALGSSFDNLEYLSGRIFDARKLTLQPQRKLDLGSVMAVWYVIANLNTNRSNINKKYNNYKYNAYSNHNSELSTWKQNLLTTVTPSKNSSNMLSYYLDHISDACQQYAIDQEISESTISKLTNYDNAFLLLKQEMLESLERRVICFNKILSSDFFNQPESPLVKSFLCGYIASRISPGSLLHSDLIWVHIEKYPSALLWYGLFAGLTHKNDVLSSFDGLGRRIVRDILDSSHLFDQPRSDISLEELEVYLTENSTKVANFRRGHSNHVAVELAPCITTALRWPEIGRSTQHLSTQDSRSDNPSDLLAELGICIKKMEDLHRRLLKSEQAPVQKDPIRSTFAKKAAKTPKWNKSKDEQGKLI